MCVSVCVRAFMCVCVYVCVRTRALRACLSVRKCEHISVCMCVRVCVNVCVCRSVKLNLHYEDRFDTNDRKKQQKTAQTLTILLELSNSILPRSPYGASCNPLSCITHPPTGFSPTATAEEPELRQPETGIFSFIGHSCVHSSL